MPQTEVTESNLGRLGRLGRIYFPGLRRIVIHLAVGTISRASGRSWSRFASVPPLLHDGRDQFDIL